MENHHDENHEELRRSQNGTQWGTDRNEQQHDREHAREEGDDEGLLTDNPEPKQDWGEVDPQAGSYDPDTDPSGPGSAV